jgi:hypothetical protein
MNELSESRRQMKQTTPTKTGRFRRFIASLAIWLAITASIVVSFGITTIESQFVLAFVGWLSACVLFEPVSSTPRWWRVAKLVTLSGFIVLGYFVFLRAQNLGIV